MKTQIAIAIAALLSTSAMAHDTNHDNNSCHFNLSKSVRVTPTFVQVLDGDKSLYRITDDSKLYAQGKFIHLNSEQQAIVDEYRDLMQELAPQVAQLVTQGLDMAKEAIDKVFTELFGDEVELKNKVEMIVEKFEQRIEPMMNEETGEYYLSKEFTSQDGDGLSQEIESEIESLIKESSGHMMVLVGKMMLKGEGGMKEFEQQMNAFGESMEVRSDQLEKNANAMCGKMEKLEALETQMQHKIPAIAAFDLLKTETI